MMMASEAEEKRADAERERWSRHDSLERGKPVRVFKGPEFRKAR